MKLPQFNAEAALGLPKRSTKQILVSEPSFYKRSGRYRMSATLEGTLGSGKVYPQRATGPYGPIGLPGQDCFGACFHMCMTFGGGWQCMERCLDTCRDSSSAVRPYSY